MKRCVKILFSFLFKFLLSTGIAVGSEEASAEESFVNCVLDYWTALELSSAMPLYYAADAGPECRSVVEFLLSRGADMYAPNKHNYTPFMHAVNRNLELALLFIKSGYRLSEDDVMLFHHVLRNMADRYEIDIKWIHSIFVLQEETVGRLPEDIRKLLLSFVLDITDVIEPKERRSPEQLYRLVGEIDDLPSGLSHMIVQFLVGYY